MNSVKKKLVIHIGTPKTGTTSIQNSFGVSRQILLENGIYYPSILPYNHGSSLMPLFIREPQNFRLFLQRKLTDLEIQQELITLKHAWIKQFELCESDTFIISAESLSHLHKDEILKLKEFVEPYFKNIQIVAYVRPFSSFISSMSQELIKQGLSTLKQCSDVTKGLSSPLTFTNSIRCWIDVFGEDAITLRPFNPAAFYKNNLLADFLNVIGYNNIDINLITEIKMNESFGSNAIIILSELNAKYPLILNKKINLRRGLASTHIPRKIYERMEDKKFTLNIQLSETEVKLLNEAIEFLNQYLPIDYALPFEDTNEDKVEVSNINSLSSSYYIDLLNEYHKEIELHYNTHSFHERLIELAATSKILYIWGASSSGLKIKNLINKMNKDIEGFIDSDSRKTGQLLEGHTIIKPSNFYEMYEKEKTLIIVASMYYDEIKTELTNKGYKENEHFIVKYIY